MQNTTDITEIFPRQVISDGFIDGKNVKWSQVEHFLNTLNDVLQCDCKEIAILYYCFIDYKLFSISELLDIALTC